MKSTRKTWVVTVSLLLVFLVLFFVRLFHYSGTVVFADPNLEAVVRDVLRIDENSIQIRDMKKLIVLDASDRGIRSLEGIQYATELRKLNLEDNFVEDVSPLADLNRLEMLSLRNNEIICLKSVSFDTLTSLPSLRELSLRHNVLRHDPDNRQYQYRLKDIGLLQHFTRLEVLELRDNHIEDPTPLAGLVQLRNLDISQNPLKHGRLDWVEDLHQLEELNLRECGIRDLEPLRDKTELIYLNLHSNEKIMTLEPISGLNNLQTLILRHVPVEDDLRYLAGMKRLIRLNLRDTGTTDVAVLADLMEAGALVDRPEEGIEADVDLRDNPIPVEGPNELYGYGLLRPYWENIQFREPAALPDSVTHEVMISEIMSSNGGTIASSDGEYYDWIELVNPGERVVDMSGWFLSDDPENTLRWQFPEGVFLEPGERRLIWASGLDTYETESGMHTSFRLDRHGEPVYLTADDGITRVDYFPPVSLPRDVSYGRPGEDPHKKHFFFSPTPGQANKEAGLERLPPVPRFSHPPGFYSDSIQLKVITRRPDSEVYVTFDGTDPAVNGIQVEDLLNIPSQPKSPPHLYTIPTSFGKWSESHGWPGYDALWESQVQPFQATVIRSRSYDHGQWSDEMVKTYWIHPDGSDRYHVPVISLVGHPDDFFHDETGILVPGMWYDKEAERPDDTGNYMNRGHEWEREVHLSFFETNGQPAVQMKAGIRVHGGWTRRFPQKSMRLYARSAYDSSGEFEYAFFPGLQAAGTGESLDSFDRLMLRNAGNDWLSTMIRDPLMQALMPADELTHRQAYQPAVVFLNGEFWGLFNLRERMDERFLASHHGVATNQWVILENNRVVNHGMESDVDDYDRMLRLIHPQFEAAGYPTTDSLKDERTLRELDRLMDISQFIDYTIAQIYFDNTDWPANNVKVWRYRRDDLDEEAPLGLDGRWRWMLYDTDFGFGLHQPGDASHNTLKHALEEQGTEWYNLPWSTFLLRALLQNDAMRQYFIDRFHELLETNFHPDQVISTINAMEIQVEMEMQEQIERWGYPAGDLDQWRKNVEALRTFARLRPHYLRVYLQELEHE